MSESRSEPPDDRDQKKDDTLPHPGTAPILKPGQSYGSVTDKIASIVISQPTPWSWIIGFGISFTLLLAFLYACCYLFARGIGIWGTTIPIAWAFPIINFVWWVGIAHAGTLISAILLLLHQDWRTSINRFAEAMTLFAVACAGLFPLLHLGRPWVFHWLLPYLNTMDLWPQFRSPLVWDVFAVLTYLTVSLLFWYAGLIPDLGTIRDRSKSRVGRVIYGMLALGWRGAADHWRRHQIAYLIMAGLATPLVISVHSIVGMDFAVAIVPGWHSAIFPPYFVAGAIFSGFAMVLTISIPLRRIYGLYDFVTDRHLDYMAKMTLATGTMVGYGYACEAFFQYYSGNTYERFIGLNRAFGPYAWSYWTILACNAIIPQVLWFRRVRANVILLFIISILVNIGMWLERFVIVVTSLHRDYLPSAWRMYYATFWDYTHLFGSIGLFFTLLFLFIRFLPMISISELRELVHEEEEGG